MQSHTQPCLEPEAWQGRKGSKDHDVSTGKIHLIVVRQECDMSVGHGHLHKWAQRMVERWVLNALLTVTPGQPKGEKRNIMVL